MTIYGTDKNLFVNGDKAKYTGKSDIVHNRQCFEVEMVEGHRTGETVWTYRKPGEMVANLK